MIMNWVESRDSHVKWSYLVWNEVETEINMINEGMGYTRVRIKNRSDNIDWKGWPVKSEVPRESG